MKLITILGAGVLAISGTFALSNNIYAIESTAESTITESAKPSRAELRAAISRIENIKDYHTYRLLLPTEMLDSTIEYYRANPYVNPYSTGITALEPTAELKSATADYDSYLYLFELVCHLEALDLDYDNIFADYLSGILTSADKAASGYALRLNYTPKPSTPAKTESVPASAPTASVAPQPSSSNHTSTPVITVAVASTTPAEPVSNQTETTNTPSSNSLVADISESPEKSDTPAENNDIQVPATGEAAKSNKPLFITLGAVALACFFIGGMIILNRKNSYHPGRKF